MSTVIGVVPFIHPGIAAAALASGVIPIIIHIIHRRRHRRVPWAAMRFLLAATQRSAKRLWLEHWLLLLLRIALIVLLGFAVARPFLPTSPMSSSAGARVHRIVVIDDSLSMNARRADGRVRFDLARESAEKLLASFPASDAVSLVRMAAPARAAIAHPAYDRRFVREQFEALTCTERAADTVGAIALAAKILRESNLLPANRTVYLISDMPAREWREEGGVSSSATNGLRAIVENLQDSARNLVIVQVADESPPNVAVTSFSPETPLVGVGIPVRLVVELSNFGQAVARDVLLQLRRAGAIIRTERVPTIAAGQSVTVLLTTAFSEPGTQGLEVRIANPSTDALSADDARFLSVEARASTPILVVDGRPGVTPLQGEAGFFATALSPKTLGDSTGGGSGADAGSPRSTARLSAIETKIITESDLATEPLAEYDLIALCNVARLTSDVWRGLEAFVSRGGGLFISVGDLVNVDEYNRFGYRGGAGLLPGKLGRAVDGRTDDGAALGFRIVTRHASVSEFGSHSASGLFSARVDRLLPLELDRGRGEVLVQYTDDSAAVVLSRFGLGHVLMWNTTVNMEWTNLPAKGDFVSLLLNLVAELVPAHGADRNVAVGGVLRERLNAAEVSLPLRITTGASALMEPSLVSASGSLAAEYGPVEHVGLSQMTVGPSVRTFAVNPSAVESDLRAVDARDFARTLGRPFRWIDQPELLLDPAGDRRMAELSTPAIVAVLFLLFAEMWLAAHWGSRARLPGEQSTMGDSRGAGLGAEARGSVKSSRGTQGSSRPSSRQPVSLESSSRAST